jgi:hypothetical protein
MMMMMSCLDLTKEDEEGGPVPERRQSRAAVEDNAADADWVGAVLARRLVHPVAVRVRQDAQQCSVCAPHAQTAQSFNADLHADGREER